jgi:hypothetical protein
MRKKQPALFKGRHFELEIVVASISTATRPGVNEIHVQAGQPNEEDTQ